MLLLRDVFDYGYDEIAAIVGKSEDNARQLAARARRHVAERPAALRGLARAARRAGAAVLRRGRSRATSAALEALLADDVVLHGDGGGKVPALARALHGRARVARTLHGLGAARARGSLDAALRAGRGERPARRAAARRRRSG